MTSACSKLSVRTSIVIGLVIALSGCAMSKVSIEERFPGRHFDPAPKASVARGHAANAEQIVERGKLPHVGPRERVELSMQWDDVFASQLGSPDYVCIGSLSASGNAFSGHVALLNDALERAAAAGADVLFIYESGTEQRRRTVTTPGYSNTTTKEQATAFGSGSGTTYGSGFQSSASVSATGSSETKTTYVPPTTHVEIDEYPWNRALLFKYVPGYRTYKEAVLRLPDDLLSATDAKLQAVYKDSSIPWSEAWAELQGIVAAAQAQVKGE